MSVPIFHLLTSAPMLSAPFNVKDKWGGQFALPKTGQIFSRFTSHAPGLQLGRMLLMYNEIEVSSGPAVC